MVYAGCQKIAEKAWSCLYAITAWSAGLLFWLREIWTKRNQRWGEEVLLGFSFKLSWFGKKKKGSSANCPTSLPNIVAMVVKMKSYSGRSPGLYWPGAKWEIYHQWINKVLACLHGSHGSVTAVTLMLINILSKKSLPEILQSLWRPHVMWLRWPQ